jgi:hypothetical protein
MDRSLDAEIANELADRMEDPRFWLYDNKIKQTIGPLKNWSDWISLMEIVRRMK